MRKSKMWRMLTVAAVAASMTCGIAGVQSVSADDKKTLKVAMECGYAPYNWTQPDDSNGAVQISGSSDYAYGYDVMMAKKIADELGYDLEIVKLDWDSLVPAVQSGQVDCVIAGQSITKERQQMVDFTDPYYYASIITLVKEDGDYKDAASVEDLKGATVTSQQNTIWYDSCLPQIPDADILPAQESAPAMLVALESGKCDAVVTDMPTGKAACVAYPDFKLLDFSRSFFADSSIHACLFRSLLLRFVSVPRTFLIFFLHSGQYFDIAEQGTYSTPHTVQFLGFNAVHRFVGVICNSPTKPMNL